MHEHVHEHEHVYILSCTVHVRSTLLLVPEEIITL